MLPPSWKTCVPRERATPRLAVGGGALGEDGGHRRERQHVVHHRRPAEEALDGGQRRLGAGEAPIAFEALEHRGLLAADVRAGTDPDLEVETGVTPDPPVLLGDGDGRPHRRHGGRILRADVDVALRGTDGEGRDGHAFDEQEGIAFHEHAVGVRAAESPSSALQQTNFCSLGRLEDGLPLDARREPGAAPAAQTGLGHLGDDVRRLHAPCTA